MKIEKGVMLIKNGKAWGITYEDGRSTEYGWMVLEDAPIHDPKWCKKPSDVTYRQDPRLKEINTGKLTLVERRTEVFVNVNRGML